jgi:hypothetical protein
MAALRLFRRLFAGSAMTRAPGEAIDSGEQHDDPAAQAAAEALYRGLRMRWCPLFYQRDVPGARAGSGGRAVTMWPRW